jgi:competence protein ComEC
VVDPAIFLGLAVLAGGISSVRAGPAALAALATLVFARRRMGRVLFIASFAAFALGAARVGCALSRFDRERAAVRDALGGPARCTASAVVVSSPVLLHSTASALARSPPTTSLTPSFDADLSDVECNDRRLLPFRARIYGGPDDLGRGDRLELVATLAPAQLFRNEELSDPRPTAARRGVLASGGAEDVRVLGRGAGVGAIIDRFRAWSRRRIEATFAPEAAPMARALVLGESDLDPEDDEAFRASGLAHLLAVSGTHLVLVVAGAVRAFSAILRRVRPASARWDVGRCAAAGGAAFAWIYADFAGGSGSAVRAAAMMSCGLAARALGRSPDGPRAFGWSLLGAALVDPLLGFDVSFLLSLAATAGLMLLQKPIASRLVPRREAWPAENAPARARALRHLSGALATTLSATIGCAPLIAFIAPTLPIGGVLANLLAVPVGELVALPLCLGHTLLGFLPLVERGAAIIASGSLLVVRSIARVTQRATWLALPVPAPSAWQTALLWSIAAGIFFARPGRKGLLWAASMVALLVSELLVRRAGAPHDLRVTVLDVGQGDASLVDLPNGEAMLVDGGGLVGSPIDTGRTVIIPLLRARRRARLAVVVLSHPHPDHFGGLLSALEKVDVGEFWDTGQGEAEGAGPAYAELLAALRARGVSIVRPPSLCGRPRSFGRARVDVLAPCPGPEAFVNPNDNSFVLRIAVGERAALLVGDAERAEERTLIDASPEMLRADFLKVGHHGSRTSSSVEFIAAVSPRDAAISCGVRNRFGHPHPLTLRALAAFCRVHRTDREGSILWQTDGIASAVHSAVGGQVGGGTGHAL